MIDQPIGIIGGGAWGTALASVMATCKAAFCPCASPER